jgi:branched-chain amino acid transport system permease protein
VSADATAVTPAARPTADAAAAPWGRISLSKAGGALLLGLLLPVLLQRLEVGNFLVVLLILFFIQAVVAQAWNLVMGYGGIYSFAQVAFFAVGGWTTGVLAHSLGWNPFLSILFAPIAAMLAALLIGLPTLRLRGTYVVLLTLAFHELSRNFAITGPRVISGGGYGLTIVPGFPLGDIGIDRQLLYLYYIAMGIFGLATFVIWRVIHSPLGVAVAALRDSETYAVSRGISQFRVRLILFGVSAFLTGLAGGYMTHYHTGISTSVFDLSQLIDLMAMIVIGGWGTFIGPILGAGIVIGLDQALVGIGDYRTLAEGLVLAFTAVFAPQGLWPMLRNAYDRYLGPEPPSSAQQEGGDET